MAIDTPARLAVLGAGPIGLEAALYARFLGYDVVVYERGDLANCVGQRGHLQMFTPFGENHTTLGLAAIQAQEGDYQPPAADQYLTGREWIDRYLAPLAGTDLLNDHLRLGTTVVAIGKQELHQTDLVGNPDRGDWSFRVLSENAAGHEQVDLFDGILDCTGACVNPNWLGHGGIPAIGERALRDKITYHAPDILGKDRARYANRRTLVVGGGLSAATSIVALVELANSEPGTRVTWSTRREGSAGAAGPVEPVENDRLARRVALAERANALAKAGGPLTYCAGTFVEQLQLDDAGAICVSLSGSQACTITVENIIANVGYRADYSFCRELQIGGDQVTSQDALPAKLRTAEPNYYILGSKSFGRRASFDTSAGYEQIRQVFKIIGDREGLDLYTSAKNLLR